MSLVIKNIRPTDIDDLPLITKCPHCSTENEFSVEMSGEDVSCDHCTNDFTLTPLTSYKNQFPKDKPPCTIHIICGRCQRTSYLPEKPVDSWVCCPHCEQTTPYVETVLNEDRIKVAYLIREFWPPCLALYIVLLSQHFLYMSAAGKEKQWTDLFLVFIYIVSGLFIGWLFAEPLERAIYKHVPDDFAIKHNIPRWLLVSFGVWIAQLITYLLISTAPQFWIPIHIVSVLGIVSLFLLFARAVVGNARAFVRRTTPTFARSLYESYAQQLFDPDRSFDVDEEYITDLKNKSDEHYQAHIPYFDTSHYPWHEYVSLRDKQLREDMSPSELNSAMDILNERLLRAVRASYGRRQKEQVFAVYDRFASSMKWPFPRTMIEHNLDAIDRVESTLEIKEIARRELGRLHSFIQRHSQDSKSSKKTTPTLDKQRHRYQRRKDAVREEHDRQVRAEAGSDDTEDEIQKEVERRMRLWEEVNPPPR